MADYQPPALELQQQDLKGKVAIVTGATKGIGRAIALDLATRGCSILGTYTSVDSAHNFDTLYHNIQELYPDSTADAPKLRGVAADITSLASVDAVIAALQTEFSAEDKEGNEDATVKEDKEGNEDATGKVDILVLNAAYNVRPRLGTATEEDIVNSLTGNVQWPIVLMESLVRDSLLNYDSRIVLLSSDRVRDPAPGASIFNACKTALESLARSWAVELPLSFPGTTVNAVSIGLTDTPGVRRFPPEVVEALKKQRLKKVKIVEGGRMGYPEDIADVVGWLVSEKARWQTGSVVAANGGAEWVGGSS